MHLARAALLAVCILAVGCKERNPNYCDPALPECVEVDAPMACDDTHPCMVGICSNNICVECVDSSTCENPAEPVCDTMSNTCGKCTAHSQCEGTNVCLPTGECGTENNVAYVDPGGTNNTTCGIASKCTSVQAALMTGKPFIKFSGTTAGQNVQVTSNRVVTFLADPGAKLVHNSGVVLEVKDASNVTVYDLHIDSLGQTVGILMPSGSLATLVLQRVQITGHDTVGVEIGGGTITIERSRISDNEGGGLDVSGTATKFNISNNFILFNGDDDGAGISQIGGALLTPNTAGSKFEYNTVVGNKNDGSLYRGGVTCAGNMVSAQGNIVVQNRELLMTTDATQKGGNCDFGDTLAQGAMLEGFKMPGAPDFDFHLTDSSPMSVRDKVQTCSGMDFDGESRPFNNLCDLGADELVTAP